MLRVATAAATLALACAVGGPVAAAVPGPDAHPSAQAVLAQTVASALQASGAAHVAIDVAAAGTPLVALHPDAPQRPASNEKLLVAVAALLRLGPGFRYDTRVLATGGPPAAGVVPGDLVLQGSGDPTFGRAQLEQLAASLAHHGVRLVTGNVVVDATRYAGPTVAPGWQPDDLPSQIAPVSALSVDQNWHVSHPPYLHDPAAANAQLWWAALKAAGIRVHGRLRLAAAPTTATRVLASVSSIPLRELASRMLRWSDNFDAEMLLRELGAHATGVGTRSSGLTVIHQVAAELGVDLGAVHDGSGLSYLDAESPAQFVAWLSAAAHTPIGPVLRADLPQACAGNGTLAGRLCAARGLVQAKTGTLTGVDTLSGYATTRAGVPVTFSVLVEGAHNDGLAIAAIDRAVLAVTGYTGPVVAPAPPPPPPAAPAGPGIAARVLPASGTSALLVALAGAFGLAVGGAGLVWVRVARSRRRATLA